MEQAGFHQEFPPVRAPSSTVWVGSQEELGTVQGDHLEGRPLRPGTPAQPQRGERAPSSLCSRPSPWGRRWLPGTGCLCLELCPRPPWPAVGGFERVKFGGSIRGRKPGLLVAEWPSLWLGNRLSDPEPFPPVQTAQLLGQALARCGRRACHRHCRFDRGLSSESLSLGSCHSLLQRGAGPWGPQAPSDEAGGYGITHRYCVWPPAALHPVPFVIPFLCLLPEDPIPKA